MGLSIEGLKGKQSVRATFRLPDHTIKLLNIVAQQLGLKQKSLFDQLMENEAALRAAAEMIREEYHKHFRGERRQKTYVISRKTLDILEKISTQNDIPRDFLVEVSIKRLVPVFETEQERHKMRLIVYKDMKRHLDQGKRLLQKAKNLLGKEDAICEMINQANEVINNNVTELQRLIDQGTIMDDFAKLNDTISKR